MTLHIFEQELRAECQRRYISLKDGSRNSRLQTKKTNSLTDVIYLGRDNPIKLFHSSVITFGHVLENTAMNYAERMNAKVFRNKNFLASNIDVIFQIDNIVHNLESKANIELDNEKTKKALESLRRKHKIVFNALDCHDNNCQVISQFVVWTKEDSIEAFKIAKRPIQNKDLMGFKDFFALFYEDVSKEDFFNMIQTVWVEEVEVYIYGQ